MTIFEFVFSLYSLLLGLALAQVLRGFGNTLQERHKIKVGWLTPLLGLFVIMDLTSFWATGWAKDQARGKIVNSRQQNAAQQIKEIRTKHVLHS